MSYNAYTPNQQRPQSYSYHSYSKLPPQAPAPTSYHPLNPLAKTTVTTVTTSYTPLAPSPQPLQTKPPKDTKSDRHIRLLALSSRILGFALALATFAPLAMTSAKYLRTKDAVVVVDGQERTVWPSEEGGGMRYHYFYLAVSAISMLVNGGVLVFQCTRGRKNKKGQKAEKAKKPSKIGTWWSILQRGAEALVWIISVAVYRYGKEPVEGKFVDLWGWACSPAAQGMQGQVADVEFAKYCTVQVSIYQERA